jgi:predicted GNAT family acetyltransferase
MQFCGLQQVGEKCPGPLTSADEGCRATRITGMQQRIDDMNNTVTNNPAHHRYELAVDGHIAATYYSIADGVITFIHTEVPPELGGKGIGSKLIKGALDKVRADGLKVIAQCPFVKAFIEKNPAYQDLLKRDSI